MVIRTAVNPGIFLQGIRKDLLPWCIALAVHAILLSAFGWREPNPGAVDVSPGAMEVSFVEETPSDPALPQTASEVAIPEPVFELAQEFVPAPVPEPSLEPVEVDPTEFGPTTFVNVSVPVRASSHKEERPRSTVTGTNVAKNSGDSSAGSSPAAVKRGPALLRSPAPPYPPEALRNKWTGVVLLRLGISETGEVVSVSLVQSSGYDLLDQAAIKGMKAWRFSPAQTTSGGAIASAVEVPVRFRLLN